MGNKMLMFFIAKTDFFFVNVFVVTLYIIVILMIDLLQDLF